MQQVAAFLVGRVDDPHAKDGTRSRQDVLAVFLNEDKARLLALVGAREVGASSITIREPRALDGSLVVRLANTYLDRPPSMLKTYEPKSGSLHTVSCHSRLASIH